MLLPFHVLVTIPLAVVVTAETIVATADGNNLRTLRSQEQQPSLQMRVQSVNAGCLIAQKRDFLISAATTHIWIVTLSN